MNIKLPAESASPVASMSLISCARRWALSTNSSQDMGQTLLRYVALYNHQLPQSALKSQTPMQAMKLWYASHPHLFHKRPYERPGCDN